jgi:predicted GIY-YIG superfamily endonuclease
MKLYVGETANLRVRINRHRAEGRPFANIRTTTIFWIPLDNRSTSTSRRKIERKLIRQHKPKFNKNSGGGGRIARRRSRER